MTTKVAQSTIDWLLQPSSPSIRALTLDRLLNRSPDDAALLETRAAIMKSPWIRARLMLPPLRNA